MEAPSLNITFFCGTNETFGIVEVVVVLAGDHGHVRVPGYVRDAFHLYLRALPELDRGTVEYCL